MDEYQPRLPQLQVIQDSDTATVKIEVPREWRLWSGWNPCLWESYFQEWQDLPDSMDDKEFDEAMSFPALKPNEEVFHVGLPSYSRKQRGWHYVKPWPPRAVRPKPTGHVHRRGATGADVPVELFDIILDYMDPLEELRSEVSLTMSKRQRGVISLVCRRWADTLRPWIFDSITLRSREDADALFSLSLRPHSDVLDYINVIEVSQSLTQYPYRPWIHTVYPAFDKLDSRIPAIHLTLCGPLPEGKFMKSICERLPASVPLYFTSITRLTLTNLHFRRVTDLVRIPRELPSLQFVHCRDITWNCPSSAEMPPASQYLSRMPVSDLDGITYALQGCTDNSVAGWFTALLAPRWRDRVQQSDAHIICHIASALARNIDSSKVPEWTMQATREEDHLGFIGRDENDPEMCLFPEFRAHLTQHVAAHARQVRAIWFHPLDVSATLEHSDWEAIGSVTATLPSLEALIIISASHADLLSFHNQILVPKMPSFHQSSKLKYVISSYDERRDEQRVRFVSCTEDKVHDAAPLSAEYLRYIQDWRIYARR